VFHVSGWSSSDTRRVSDKKEEIKNGEVRRYNLLDNVRIYLFFLTQKFELTECVEYTSESAEEIAVLAQLEPTYEVCKLSLHVQLSLMGLWIPYTNSSASSAPLTPCRRITKAG
jgi:hypothetical protein